MKVEYLTTQEVMKQLGLKDRNVIYRYVRNGKLKAVRFIYRKGQPYGFSQKDVTEFKNRSTEVVGVKE